MAFLIDLLDQMDGDVDLEPQCEDEGAQCEDEGAQCDDEGYQDPDSDDLESEDVPLFPNVSIATYDAQHAAACEASKRLRAIVRRKRGREPSSVHSNVGPIYPLVEIAPGILSTRQ